MADDSDTTAQASRPPWSHRALGVLARACVAALGALPYRAGYVLADLAALPVALYTACVLRDWRSRSRGFHRNLRIAYRERVTSRLSRRLLIGYSRHMTRMVVDFCKLPRLDAGRLADRVVFDGVDRIRELLAGHGRLIFVTGHVGIPDLCGHVGAVLGFRVTGVFQPSPVAPITAVVSDIRASGGQRVIAKAGAMWALKKTLDRGESIGFAADASAKGHGVFAPFLGTLAETNATAALLHRHTRVPIAVVTGHRTGCGRYRMVLRTVIEREPTADRDADVFAVTTAVNDALSAAIEEFPEQWFWHCRRFRWRPHGEVPGPDGLPPRAAGAAGPALPDALAR